MGIVSYALFTYALTAVISFGVVAIIVLVNKAVSSKEVKEESDNE